MLRVVVIAFALAVCSGPVVTEKATVQRLRKSTASRNVRRARATGDLSG